MKKILLYSLMLASNIADANCQLIVHYSKAQSDLMAAHPSAYTLPQDNKVVCDTPGESDATRVLELQINELVKNCAAVSSTYWNEVIYKDIQLQCGF